jgi:hypothetical protein
LLGWVKDDAEYIATQSQVLTDIRKAQPDAANRETHPIREETQEESDHVEPQ